VEDTIERRNVLRFENARLHTGEGAGGEAIDLHLSLYGGDLILVNSERPRFGSIFADACCGLNPPVEGKVFFLGKDWASLPADTANALRGRIGRAFIFGNWINRLTLMENILLSQQHHTRRESADLQREAASLALHFGLPGLPSGSPDDLIRADHQRAVCIRAFLGQPSMILLEEPTFGAYSDLLLPLVNAIRNACDRGCGVVWLTLEDQVWNDPLLPVTARYRLSARQLMEVSR
jgi:phospholipid/cholesterol/gamma-HCH transport system ATP-binding protein